MRRLFDAFLGLAVVLVLMVPGLSLKGQQDQSSNKTDQTTKQSEQKTDKTDKKDDKKVDKMHDPDYIGNRDVGKGVNFYSIEKEIALGKELAQDVERQAKIIDDPVIAEYVNRVGQNLVRNSDAKFRSPSR